MTAAPPFLVKGTKTTGLVPVLQADGSIQWAAPAPGGSASGDLTGSYPGPTIASGKVSPDKVKAGSALGNILQIASDGTFKWVRGSANQLPSIISPLFMNPALLVNATFAPGSGTARGNRYVAPRDGTISGVAVFISTSAGNIDVAILDTTVTTRNVLYKSGSFACPAASLTGWTDLGINPNLAVVAGQQFDVAITNNNASFGIARGPALATAIAGRLPDGYMTGGVTSGSPAQYLGWSASVAVGSWGTTLAESALAGAGIVAIILKMA